MKYFISGVEKTFGFSFLKICENRNLRHNILMKKIYTKAVPLENEFKAATLNIYFRLFAGSKNIGPNQRIKELTKEY